MLITAHYAAAATVDLYTFIVALASASASSVESS